MLPPNPSIPEKDLFIYNINNNNYWFSLVIYNLTSRYQIVKPAAIKQFVIEDAFQDFYHKGHLIIRNDADMLEQNYITEPAQETIPGTSFTFSNINPATNATNKLDGFVLQGDSRDVLQVNIMPLITEGNIVGPDFGDENRQKLFRLTFDFAIYHTEDIEGEGPNEKYKKLYFWDLYYEMMREQNSYFSTSYYQTQNYNNPDDTSLINKSNSERGIPTGKALKSLLIESFNDTQNGLGVYPVSFNVTSNTGTGPSTDPNWDDGGSSLFFSAPAQYKVIDSLNYILSRHVSTADKDFDQCFLRLERYPRVFTFKSLTDYFLKAYERNNELGGEYYLETIKIAGFSQATGPASILEPIFELNVVPEDTMYLDKYGTPNNLVFSDMSGIFSQLELNSRVVHSYNYTEKAFQLDSQENHIETTYNVFQSNYCSNMKGGAKNVPNFTIGDMRYKRLNTGTVFSVVEKEKDQRLASGRNKSLYAGIFANAVVTFRIPGSTHRQAGKFLGIDRDSALQTNIFDNKILGIYFIIEVKHIFEDGEYINEIKCVKTYYPTNELNSPPAI